MAWGKHFYACECCGTTEHEYHSKGLCSACYYKKRYRENERAREVGKIATERWREKHREHNLAKMRAYAQNKHKAVVS